MRADTRPRASAVASVIAVGSLSPLARALHRAARGTSPSPLGKVRASFARESVRIMRRDASTRAGYDRATSSMRCSTRCRRACAREARRWSGFRACRPAARARSRRSSPLRRTHAASRPKCSRSTISISAAAARAALARDVHPLLATRGVPGTHDVALLDSHARCAARCVAQRNRRAFRASTKAATRACRRRAGGA